MISSTYSGSKTTDLMSPQVEGVLQDLMAYISQRTGQAKQNLTSSLSGLVATSYYMGGDKAAKEIGGHFGPMGLDGMDTVIDRIGTSLDTVFGSMSGELTDIIEAGIKNGWTYERVKEALAEKIQAGWGDAITFDSTGTAREVVKVAPNGALSWEQKVITQPITLPTDTYAETLARTSMKQAYTAGHFTRYEGAGYEGWVYLSVVDERTRPSHLALHGRVFQFGTPEEAMAREVMREYNCRCRPKAWFNDPEADTDPSVYAGQRAAWAQQAIDELPEDQSGGDIAKYLQQIIKHSAAAA